MQTIRRPRDIFTSIKVEGAILPPDLLQRVANGGPNLAGLDPEDYHLVKSEKLNEAINRSWNRMLGLWAAFRDVARTLPATDLGTTITRERWLLPLFQELGYGRLTTTRALEINGLLYPVSHAWGQVPIHLVGCKVDLDTRTAGVAGAARTSPHSLVQQLLNRSDDHLWAFLSNGLALRILRDNYSLTRQSFVEFDLETMFDGEVYADFALLWLLCHESRVAGEPPEECWLEKWSKAAQEQGTRALEYLRRGVESAITSLGRGFLAHPFNRALRDRLQSGQLSREDYYRQVLRLVYRLLFLLVAEGRDLLLSSTADPATSERYIRYYSLARLRRLAERRLGTRHADLYQGLRLVMEKLGSDEGYPALGLYPLGGFLFSSQSLPDLSTAELGNFDLLEAIRALTFLEDGGSRRPVDYRNLGPEELGSVYEALLELHPVLNVEAGTFVLQLVGGSERKTSGSYYTPTSLINSLLDTALEPVLAGANTEEAVLNLKVCDPACGSGHFLLAAANRIARKLAAIRTGESEPAPTALRQAKHDVIRRCIYGVDVNPMSVELCKVSLWIEALDPGRPLSFLDHHIQCGNSLLGTTPALLAKGIPDEAFEPIEGDDKAVCRDFKKRNKEEHLWAGRLFDAVGQPWEQLGDLSAGMMLLDETGDDTVQGERSREQLYAELVRSQDYLYGRFLADAWCAAFVWKKNKEFAYPITQEIFRKIRENPFNVVAWMQAEVERLARQYSFFHWHLAFPDVFPLPTLNQEPENEATGWNGGFDLMIGNPPWEHTELKEQEWFAVRHPGIATAQTGAIRKKMIDELVKNDSALHTAFLEASREHEGVSQFIRGSQRYPLCARGRINTFAIFAENFRLLQSPTGRAGIIVPSGIATDDSTKFFFQDISNNGSLVSLYDFENREALFPGVHRSYKFCLLTLAGSARPFGTVANFVFFAFKTADLRDEERQFTLSHRDIALLNPNTFTCPIFRSKRDAELTKTIYRRVPVLIKEGPPEVNPWGISFKQGLFNMASDSSLFRTYEQLTGEGWQLQGNKFVKASQTYLPLYEAKLLHQYDHRWATYEGLETRDFSSTEKRNPNTFVMPRYWVPEKEVHNNLESHRTSWLLAFRDITNTTNERTSIFSLLPIVGIGHTAPIMFVGHEVAKSITSLITNLSSFAFDYIARQKVGGMHLTYGYLKQLPVLLPSTYEQTAPWTGSWKLGEWILPRVLELTYTAWDLQSFAHDSGYDGPPFAWDEERRFQLRCELDAAYFHLYGINREDVDYIMDTFPIVRRKDEQQYGEYRTKQVILELYDQMEQSSNIPTKQPLTRDIGK